MEVSFDHIMAVVGTVVNLLGVALVLYSIRMLAKQTKEMARQTKLSVQATRSSVYQSVSSTMIEIDRFFVEHPHLRPYFYHGKELALDDPHHNEVGAAAEMMMDFVDSVFMLAPNMPDYPWEKTWYRYFRDQFESSPVLLQYLKDRASWYLDGTENYYPKWVRDLAINGMRASSKNTM